MDSLHCGSCCKKYEAFPECRFDVDVSIDLIGVVHVGLRSVLLAFVRQVTTAAAV